MMRFACFVAAATALIILGLARPAAADLRFYNVFVDEYIKNHPNKKYVELVTKEAKCLVCHQGKKRKNRNPFGVEVDKLLDRKTDSKNREKISAALKKVVALHVDPKDKKSEIYADRIKAGKLPGGELKELQKEPPEEKSEEK